MSILCSSNMNAFKNVFFFDNSHNEKSAKFDGTHKIEWCLTFILKLVS